MRMVRQVIVFDAADIHAESAFWPGSSEGASSRRRVGIASLTRLMSGGLECSTRRTTSRLTGLTAAHNSSISISTSKILGLRTRRRWPSGPDFSSQQPIWTPIKVTRHTPILLDIRFALDGGIPLEMR
jgi:hypothetical protein